MLARILDRIVKPLGLRCIPIPKILPAPELPYRCLENAQIVPERTDILRRLPRRGVVAEVGVGFGAYSRKIIDIMQPAQFVAIDTFQLEAGANAYANVLRNQTHEQYYRKQFSAEIDVGTLVIRKGYSNLMLDEFPDQYFDMIYVDAAHDYQSVVRDLAAANRKLKRSGHIVLNDYTIVDPLLLQHYDIVRATNEFCLQEDWEIVYLALHPMMFCDVALRKPTGHKSRSV